MVKLHTSREYERELENLRQRLMGMAKLVEQMIANATHAMIHHDTQLAQSTIEMDRRVNRDEVELDEFCLLLLARRQPVGTDLRFITIALKMVTDLERIGDIAVNICHRVLKGKSQGLEPHSSIPRMAVLVQEMIREAIEAFVQANVQTAERVIRCDNEMDELYHQVTKDALAMMRGSDGVVDDLLYFHSVAKWLERVGDHCTNLAELVVFMVRGTDIRHATNLQ